MDVASNAIEQMLGSTALKEIKSVMDLGSDIECVQRIKSTIGAVLDKYHPFEASSDLERRKIKKFRRIYDELVYFFEEQGARTKVMDRRNIAAEERVLTTPLINSRDNFNTNSNPVPDACLIRIHGDISAPSLSDNLFAHLLKTIRSKTLGNKHSFKLMLIALNVIAEVGQAAISQEKNDGKMGSNLYLELSIIISSFCLMMVLVEAFYEAQKYGVVWQKRGRFRWWLYYRENQGRPFGSFSLYLGFISSMIQLIIHLTEKLTKKNIIKFDYMPLLLAVCYLVAATMDHPGEVSRTDQGSIIEDHESRSLGYGDNPGDV